MKKLFVIMALAFMTNVNAAPAVWLIGDSTVSNYPKAKYPQTGWGQVIGNFCVEGVKINNIAAGGRSTKSFLAEGRWKRVMDGIKAGDYLFIQFGHNDQKHKKPRIHAPADGLYKELLHKYISEAREKGAKPILVTSVCRFLQKDGKIYNSLGKYPEAMREVAKESKTPLIDLNAISLAKFNELGAKACEKIFLFTKPGEFEAFPEGKKDRSHFCENGATTLAGWIASDAKNQKLDITEILK